MALPHNHDPAACWDDGGLTEDEHAAVDSVLIALAQPRLEAELAAQDEAVAAVIGRMHARGERTRPALRLAVPAFPGGRSLRLAVAVAGAFAATSGAAFAGVLPGPAQHVASQMFSAVGVQVPYGPGVRSDRPVAPARGGIEPPATVSRPGHDRAAHGHAGGVRVRAGQTGGGPGTGRSRAHHTPAGPPVRSHGQGTPPADPGASHAGQPPVHPSHPAHPPAEHGSGGGGASHSSGSPPAEGGGGHGAG
ncbi:MAG TPA: hypothetical protein VGC71_11745 [Gaiellales bacterium]|jgi:hypothetical protein